MQKDIEASTEGVTEAKTNVERIRKELEKLMKELQKSEVTSPSFFCASQHYGHRISKNRLPTPKLSENCKKNVLR